MNHFGDLGVTGRLMLSLTVKKYGTKLRIEFSWLRTGYSTILIIRAISLKAALAKLCHVGVLGK
jgi:hypothetical protein